LVVFFPRVVSCRGCVGSQIRLAACVSIGKYVALNMFRATLCPSSGAEDLVVFFFACGVVQWLCRQSDLVGWLCVHWEVRSYVYWRRYKLLNMFRATLCPSSGADDLVVFLPRVV